MEDMGLERDPNHPIPLPSGERCTFAYANAHRGKIKKASLGPLALRIVEDKLRAIPAQGWAEMIRKVYEVEPLVCPKCGGTMKIIAFLTDYAVVDRIIDHLKLTFVAKRPPSDAPVLSRGFDGRRGLH